MSFVGDRVQVMTILQRPRLGLRLVEAIECSLVDVDNWFDLGNEVTQDFS